MKRTQNFMLLSITLVSVFFNVVSTIDLGCMNITEVEYYRMQVTFCPLSDEANLDYYRASVLDGVDPKSCDVTPDTRGHSCYIPLEQFTAYNISGVVCDLAGSCSEPIVKAIETPIRPPSCLSINGGFSNKPLLDVTICLPSRLALITRYEILASATDSAFDCTLKADAKHLGCRFEGALPGTVYGIRARACTPTVCSQYFDSKYTTLPEVLECFTVEGFNTTQTNLTLCPPKHGNPVLGNYMVEITDPKAAKACSVSQSTRKNVTCKVDNLLPDTWYKLRARGCDSKSLISCSQWKHVEFRTLKEESKTSASDMQHVSIFLLGFLLISVI